ncbi:HD domain-containing protein [Lachnospiraceae bacterium XBB2008]|nr:HD domain-containing protein [Lachnospiraceae bacterium XBB2008]
MNNQESGKRFADTPKPTILIPIILYIILYFLTAYTARSGEVIMIGSNPLPLSALAGVITSLSGIVLVHLVLHHKKAGFIIALALIIFPLPSLVNWILQGNVRSLPGLFTNILTIIMLVIIMINHVKMEKEQERLHRLFDQTSIALVNAIDAKDKYTRGHSSRVAEYSRRLAEMNGKNPEECDEVYYSALLHDVGKIGVPSSIINKSGKLTSDEYEVVKQHPVTGAQILEKIDEYPYLSIGAHYHHEHYDGSGYPEGLKSNEIPEIARIISVADAYDAMTSTRSYRDPIPQDKVREEIVMGAGTQFDPDYARLMLLLIDKDTDYKMKELSVKNGLNDENSIIINEFRSVVTPGLLVNSYMTTVRMMIGSADEATGVAPEPCMILFDSLDGITHSDENEIRDRLYFEYGEIRFDGRTRTLGARKMETQSSDTVSSDISSNGEYMIEAVRIRDHALIRIIGKNQTSEVIVALPDSTRFLYIGFTGEHCSISDMAFSKETTESPADLIPRIAEEISYIDVPAGDIPNVQIDGYRTNTSESTEIRNGLKISFHTQSLPTARLVWHCPSLLLFHSDDGKVNGINHRDIAFIRFDGEFWLIDPDCKVEHSKITDADHIDWDSWKGYNRSGYDSLITFEVKDNRITVSTDNGGISIRHTVIPNANDKIYAALTGDQVALTNIRIK